MVNVGVKPVFRRRAAGAPGPCARTCVPMPESHSYPSGHAASAFAFSTAVGAELPSWTPRCGLLATTVAYSRVHTGVHYPAT